MIKFIEYTGKYPNLCSGVLTLEVDEKLYNLSHALWSGGRIVDDPNFGLTAVEGPWSVNLDEYPELIQYQTEIEELVNENIQCGCCGGCI